jgi:disulfide oxidoreductase YuzD
MKMISKRVLFVVLLCVCCVVGPNLTWRFQLEWIQNSISRKSEYKQASTKYNDITKDNLRNASLLIVQYTGGNTYSALLNLTQPINEAYAEMWGYDYQLFTGLLIQKEIPPSSNENNTKKVPESRATYNKVMILYHVLTNMKYQQYNKLLILDSDALMYDFSRDIATLIPDNRMMLAHRVKRNDTDATWDINIGVTLWNLRHVATFPFCKAWKKACLNRIINHPTLRDSDQTPLQAILKEIPEDDRRKMIMSITSELGYGFGKFVRHFIRPDCSNWTDYTDTMPRRVEKIQSTITEICNKTFTESDHPDICSEYIDYAIQTKAKKFKQ